MTLGRVGAHGTDHRRVTELTGEIEVLRKQFANAEHELDRPVMAGQVITQLTASCEVAGPARAGAARRVPSCWCPAQPCDRPDGPSDDYRWLLEAVAEAEAGGPGLRRCRCGPYSGRRRAAAPFYATIPSRRSLWPSTHNAHEEAELRSHLRRDVRR